MSKGELISKIEDAFRMVIYDLVSRYKIDGNPLKNYIDSITIEEYVALLDA